MTPGPHRDPLEVVDRSLSPGAVVLVLLVSLAWRVPSLFDPPWVNDEGTYFAVAQAMAHGYRLYSQVWENKPPAVYLVYEGVYHAIGPSLIAVRVLATLAALLIVLLVAVISRQYAPPCVALASALLAGLLLGVPFLEGTTANAEIFFALLTALAAWFAVVKFRPGLAGVPAGLAILFKAVAAFDAVAIAIWLIPRSRPGLAHLALGFGAVVSVTVLLAYRVGILRSMLRDALLYDLGYVGTGNGSHVPWLLGLKLVALLALTLWLRRDPFPYLWLAYATAGALFSGRIFGHYFIQVIAPLCVSAACLLRNRPLVSRRAWYLLPGIFLGGALLAAAAGWMLAATGHDSILARRLQYYANFTRLALRLEPYSAYRNQIDDHVARNIQLAQAVRRAPAGTLLVWGNVPWVYVLSHRLPATPYTSSLRQPEVPGETATLHRALRRGAIVVVVIEPPLPRLGSAAGVLRRRYRVEARIDNGTVYVPRG